MDSVQGKRSVICGYCCVLYIFILLCMVVVSGDGLQQFLNMKDSAEGKKISGLKRLESEDSSSLEFLGSDKDNDDNENDNDEGDDNGGEIDINSLNVPSKRKKSPSQPQPPTQPIPPSRKKQRCPQEQNSSQSTFLYKPGVQLPNLFSFTNFTIKVIIAAEYITRDNPQVLRHHIFGSDTYAANSDCVCIGVHFGLFGFASFQGRKYEGVQIVFKVIKPKKIYNGSHKNGIISESIRNYNGNGLKPESSRMLTSLGSLENLQKYAANMRIPLGKTRIRAKPQNVERIVALPQANFVFNMNNEPAYKYSIYNIADKGFDKSQFLLRKLDTKVLYLETASKQRYQLYKYIEKTYFEAYRLSQLKSPLKYDNEYFAMHPPPLEAGNDGAIEVLESVVEWDQIVFGVDSVRIKDTRIQGVVSFKFYGKGVQRK